MIGKYAMADELEKYEKKQEGSTLPNGYKFSFHFGSADLWELWNIVKQVKKVAPNLRIYLFTSFISQQNKNLLTYYIPLDKKSPSG